MNKKGAIGIIASERNNFSWLFIQSLLKLTKRMPELEIIYGHSGNIADGRNFIVQMAKEKGLDYVCMIDSDMVFPADGIERLLETMEMTNADVGAGLYFVAQDIYKPAAYTLVEGVYTPVEIKDVMEIDGCGMGFTIITSPYFDVRFDLQPGKGEDFTFCERAKERGARIIFDPAVKLGHLRTVVIDEVYCNERGYTLYDR